MFMYIHFSNNNMFNVEHFSVSSLKGTAPAAIT